MHERIYSTAFEFRRLAKFNRLIKRNFNILEIASKASRHNTLVRSWNIDINIKKRKINVTKKNVKYNLIDRNVIL